MAEVFDIAEWSREQQPVWTCECGEFDHFELHPDGDIQCSACGKMAVGIWCMYEE
jgi:hypothetical protein